ncbi:hydrogenase nickel incorporation protein HypB [Actinomadura verrucosospora]|uniref:Hydrogenase nickel incorporation protein HypB n=1 Tax=Actinomadura verrucosospora TaxID=46165 RepID=A0A7D3VTG8_ACTVE|nr:hydrogenase nickel incorporation protein HypB [Actinomadura verrucosospora]QKG22293.1 hydrogenase nickel incorporation protein HypB [Actinomadura verrucosospora]
MCETCGCDAGDAARLTTVGGASHAHPHPHPHERVIVLDHKVLSHNDDLAARNRAWLDERGILALNVMSSPGSGKTTLLERTVADLSPAGPVAVIEGDQETVLDARRLAAAGARTVQVNTGSGCHLDAAMVSGALTELAPPDGATVFVENVGNLVCPALFDLGERARVVLMSVTEGADKPLKYPHMFRGADVLLLNKIDLLPYVDFDVDACREAARRLCPGLRMLPVSAARGDGLGDWYDWLDEQR